MPTCYDFQVAGKWAFEGKLEDLCDVLDADQGRFAPNTLETTFLYNDKAHERAYYAFPMKQQTMHIQYWIDMLAKAGLQGNATFPRPGRNIGPSGATRSSPAIRKATGTRRFGIGQPMGVDSSDSSTRS